MLRSLISTNEHCCERQYCEAQLDGNGVMVRGGWTCEAGYVRKDRELDLDPAEGTPISNEECCDMTCAAIPGMETCPESGKCVPSCREFCTDFQCPEGYSLREDKDSIPPVLIPVSTSECCDRIFCTGFSCPAGSLLSPLHAVLPAAGVAISGRECCQPDCSTVPGMELCDASPPGDGGCTVVCLPEAGRRQLSEHFALGSGAVAPVAGWQEEAGPAHRRRLQEDGDDNGRFVCNRADDCTYTEVCTATAAILCDAVVLDGSETTCTDAGDCTYTPAGGGPSGNDPETCVATAAPVCAAVVLDGFASTCTGAGACSFTETCTATATDFCDGLPLDGTASSCTGPQPICCAADVTGMCAGNTNPSEDVSCPSWATNKGPGAEGTTAALCCDAYKCSGNADGVGDVSCEAGMASSAVSLRTQDDSTAECCAESCSGWDASNDCADGTHLREDAAAVPSGEYPQPTCCTADITGVCAGNTDPSEDVACSESWIGNKGPDTAGADAGACCEAYKCSGNADSSGDASCGAGMTWIASSAATSRTQEDSSSECCAESCSGWDGSNDCTTGTHVIAAASTTLSGDAPATTCCEADVAEMCSGNTDPSEDVVCADSWMGNVGPTTAGTDAATCCEAFRCSGNADSAGDVTCPQGMTLLVSSTAIVRSQADSTDECCTESCSGWSSSNECEAGTHLIAEAATTSPTGHCHYTAAVAAQTEACVADSENPTSPTSACSDAVLDGTETPCLAAGVDNGGVCTYIPEITEVTESCAALAAGNCSATGIDGLPQAVCGAGSWFNRVTGLCVTLLQCTGDQYESVAPTVYSDRQCVGLTICNTATHYEDVAPTLTSDRHCAMLTQCDPNEEFESVANTPTSDRQCEHKVEAVVCLSFCEVVFSQCGNTLPEEARVADAVAFCELLFLKDQIRVEDAAIDITRHFDVFGDPIPHCLYIDTPPLVDPGITTFRIFTDESLVEIPVSATDAETDDMLLTVFATADEPSLVTLSIRWVYAQSTFVLSMSPRGRTGSTDVTICSTDANGGEHCVPFLLEVFPDQTPPGIEMSPMGTVMEDSVGLVMLRVIEIDRPPESVTISVLSSNEALISTSSVAVLGPTEEPCASMALGWPSTECRHLELTPLPDVNGVVTLSIIADDGVYTGNATFVLNVGPTNDPPTITSTFNDVVGEEDNPVNAISVSADDDGDPVINAATGGLDSGDLVLQLVFNIEEYPGDTYPWTNYLDRTTYTVEGDGTGTPFTFEMFPPPHAFGEATVWVEVTDGEFMDRKQFHWKVLPVNDAPNMSSVAPIVTDEDVPYVFALPLNDVDNPMDQLRLTGYSSNAMVLPARDLRFSLTNDTWFMELHPLLNRFGSSMLSISVTDGLLRSFTEFNFTVTAVNDPPLASDIQSQLNNTDLLLTEFTLTDVETESSEFSVARLATVAGLDGNPDTMEYVLPCRNPCIYAQSSNEILVPLSAVRFGGSDDSRFLTVEPNQVMSGEVVVSIFLDDLENTTRFDLSYDLISSTVDVTLTLAGTVEEFGSSARLQARTDLAEIAAVDVSKVTILEVRAGSVIVIAAIKVDSPDAGAVIANELTRLASFGQLEIGGMMVESLDLSVVGESFETAEWESMNDMWAGLALGAVCLIVAMMAISRAVLVSQSTHDELISTLKAEIIERQEEEGFLSLKKEVKDEPNWPDGEEPLYLEFDIRHVIIWVGTIFEALQVAWIVVDADARELGWRSHETAATVLDGTAVGLLDLHETMLFDFATGGAAFYGFLPGLWLAMTFIFVTMAGHSTLFLLAWNKRGILPKLDRMVGKFWAIHRACCLKLLHHRDELAGLFLDGVMYMPVLRSCFKMLSCRFDLPIESQYEERTKFRVFSPTLYLIEDPTMVCWTGEHALWAGPAIVLLLGFVFVAVRFTVEVKGRAGGAMRFSSRLETARVISLLFLAALSQIASDQNLLVVLACLGVTTAALVANVHYQPALGSKGAQLNTCRSGLLAMNVYLSACSVVLLASGGASPAMSVVFIALGVPACCVIARCSSKWDKKKRHKVSRHIEKALAGGITEEASVLATEGNVVDKHLDDFVHSSVDMLFLVLDSHEAERRAHAATALGEIALSAAGNSKVLNIGGIRRMMDLVTDESPAVRASAMLALANVACTDAGLDELGNPDIVPLLQDLLSHEEHDAVFGPTTRLLCTVLYCHDPDVRKDGLDTLLGMTSHLDDVAREEAWTALHKLGLQTDHVEAQDEVTTALIAMLLKRQNSMEQRIHAARKLYDIVDDSTHDTSHVQSLEDLLLDNPDVVVSKTLRTKHVDQLLGGILASNDPNLDQGEEGATMVRSCAQLLRLMAVTHNEGVRAKVLATTLEALTSEALEREGVETFKKEIRNAAIRM